MSTVNTNFFMPKNQHLARLINELGEILLRENSTFYEQVILETFDFN